MQAQTETEPSIGDKTPSAIKTPSVAKTTEIIRTPPAAKTTEVLQTSPVAKTPSVTKAPVVVNQLFRKNRAATKASDLPKPPLAKTQLNYTAKTPFLSKPVAKPGPGPVSARTMMMMAKSAEKQKTSPKGMTEEEISDFLENPQDIFLTPSRKRKMRN